MKSEPCCLFRRSLSSSAAAGGCGDAVFSAGRCCRSARSAKCCARPDRRGTRGDIPPHVPAVHL